jgi:hypothetical protein
MQYIPLEYNNNNNIKHVGMVLTSNGMLLSHFKRNRDANPPHLPHLKPRSYGSSGDLSDMRVDCKGVNH